MNKNEEERTRKQRSIINKNTEKYVVQVIKKYEDDQEGYNYVYHVWVSDFENPKYRIYSAVGPDGFVIREHGFIEKNANEADYLKNRIRQWHPDHDTLEFDKK